VIAPFLASALLELSPCDDADIRSQRIAAAATSDDRLRVEIDVLEGDLRAPLLTAAERTLPREDQASLATRRLLGACELGRIRSLPDSVDRARLTAILDRPEMRHARERQDIGAELWRRFWDWFTALAALRGTQLFSIATQRFVLVLGFVVAIGAALRLIRRRRAPLRATTARPGAQPLQLDTPGVHLAAARTALGSDRREAIRQALLGLVSALERRHWAHPDRVKTNRELAAELPRRGAPPEVVQCAGKLFSWFDDAFYSQRDVPLDEASGFVADVSALEAGLARAG
jgi:hypothetical protein